MKLSQRKSKWHSLLGEERNGDSVDRRERRGFQTRERLFHAAMNLFRDHGFHETTVEDITKSADVGKGTFFNYFPSKEHILSVLAEVQTAKYDKAAILASEGTTQDALRWLYRALPAEAGSSTKMVRSLFTVFLNSESVRGFLVPTLTNARLKLVAIFREAELRGEIPQKSDWYGLAFRFQQCLFGSMLLWTLQVPTPPLEKWLDHGFEGFWSAATAAPETACNRKGSKE